MTDTDANILIVAADDADAAGLAERLRRLEYAIAGPVASGRRALQHAEHARPDLALIDLGLAGELSGPQAAEQLGSRFEVPVVYLVAAADGAEAAAAAELWRRAAAGNPLGCVVRPFADRQLLLTIEAALAAHARQRASDAALRRKIDGLEDDVFRTKSILDSLSDGVVAFDRDRRVLLYNQAAWRIGGAEKLNDLPVMNDWAAVATHYERLHSDESTPVVDDDDPFMRALTGGVTDDVEMFVRGDPLPEGVHLSVRGSPLVGRTGAVEGAVIVLRDINRIKHAESELRHQNEIMDTAFRSISDGVVVANAAGEFLYGNPAAEQIVGMAITDGRQEEWPKLYGTFHTDRETPMATEDLPMIRAIHRGEAVDEEYMFIRNPSRPDGVYVRISARPLRNNIGGIRGGVIVFRDVTERVFAEEALARAFAEGRLEVVETILHNIGNAITSVTTGVETLRRDLARDRFGRRLAALAAAVAAHRDDWIDYLRHDPQGRKVLPFVGELAAGYARETEALTRTVDRVRDRANRIAEIVRTQKALGAAGTDRKDVDLYDTLAAAVRVMRDTLAKRGIRTSIDCKRAPREIRVRESQFHQMLVNLIKNAIEAIDELAAGKGLGERPEIRIEARTDGEFFVLDVIDNGVGLGTDNTRLLFAPGYTTKPSGSGLGLHSAANFVIGSGGRIEPSSQGPGTGTTMRVKLPLSTTVRTPPPPRKNTG